MNQPTKELIQWLWEQCGVAVDKKLTKEMDMPKVWWSLPNGEEYYGDMLEPDLNNLFLYAVPKIIKSNDYFMLKYDRHNNEWYCQVGLSSSRANDPALALFWAIYKALGGKE